MIMKTVITNDIVRRTMITENTVIRVVFPSSSDPLSPVESNKDSIMCCII